tara:strand:+ start:14842 stop:14976 length:135 start_codon:yes stop_codon:yes gene_type:complete
MLMIILTHFKEYLIHYTLSTQALIITLNILMKKKNNKNNKQDEE